MKTTMIAAGGAAALALGGAAQAQYIKTLGNDEACVAVGGACTALEGSLGSYAVNPAALADLERPRLGFNARIINTQNLDLRDDGGNQTIDGTNTQAGVALSPTLAGYVPLSDRITVGVGVGAPYAITADWGDNAGIHRYNMSDQALFILDVAPSIGIRATDKLTLGATVSVTAFKHLRTQTLIPDSFGAALPPELGGAGTIIPTGPDNPVIGAITLNTDDDIDIGLPPDNLQAEFGEAAVILGARYQLTDRLRLGISGRTRTRTTFEGDVNLAIDPVGVDQTVPFRLRLDMPAHLHAGGVYALNDRWEVMAEYQRTFWSSAVGLGSPAVIRFQTPLLGFVNDLRLDYQAEDTNSVRFGARYAVTPRLTASAGYAYEDRVFPDSRVDVLTYDSNRNIFSGGVAFDTRADQSKPGWIFTASLQWVRYSDRDIATGESANLGGVSLPGFFDADSLTFTPNRSPFGYGGSIRALSFGVQKVF